MRTVFAMAVLLAMLSALGAPARAQVSIGTGGGTNPQTADEIAEKQRKEQIDREYKSTIRRTVPVGAASAASDPWRTVRDTPGDKRKH